jgi:FkbM family methyltransferase
MDPLTQHPASGLWLPSWDEWWLRMLRPDRDAAFEPDSLAAGVSHVRDRRIAVDVGAHIGTSARWLARRFERVIAFEPHPVLVECLRRNTADLPGVTVVDAALGNYAGDCGLSFHGGTSGEFYVVPGVSGHRMMTLDSLDLPALDFMKLDVEGYELRVLEGAAATVARTRPVVLLETATAVDNHGFGRAAATDWLVAAGLVHLETTPDFVNAVYAHPR